MALLMRELVANTEQSHEHGEKLEEDRERADKPMTAKLLWAQFVLHSELDQEQLFLALTTLVWCPPNTGQSALESCLHSAGSLG